MAELKRHVYACRVIDPDARDVARAHQHNVLEMHPAEIGEIRQLWVDLDDEGVAAYRAASNLVELEEAVEATAQGFFDEEDGEVAEASTGPAGVAIPANEDTEFAYSKWLRGGKQGGGVTVAVLDLDLGAPVAKMLSGHLSGHKSWVGTNKNSAKHHGSHVAASALPENAKLLFGAVIGENGSGSSADIIAGIHWAIDSGADVMNLSLAGQGGGASYERAIKRARDQGILVFCAAGNEAQRGNPVMYPAACPSAISVAAFDRRTDRKASFSTWNSAVDIAHSGVNTLSYAGNGSLMRMSGTSMASPLCTWVAAGLAAENGARGDELLKAILSGARNTPAGSKVEGHGVVHARNANAWLEKEEEPEEPEPEPSKNTLVIFRGTGDLVRYEVKAAEPMEYIESQWSSRQTNDVLSDGGKTAKGAVSTGVDTLRTAGEIKSVEFFGGKMDVEMKGE